MSFIFFCLHGQVLFGIIYIFITIPFLRLMPILSYEEGMFVAKIILQGGFKNGRKFHCWHSFYCNNAFGSQGLIASQVIILFTVDITVENIPGYHIEQYVVLVQAIWFTVNITVHRGGCSQLVSQHSLQRMMFPVSIAAHIAVEDALSLYCNRYQRECHLLPISQHTSQNDAHSLYCNRYHRK